LGAHLLHRLGKVNLDCFIGSAKIEANLLVQHADHHKPENFSFSDREERQRVEI